jgi:coenzyme F420 biosynthesis associated uncharacterized protein
MTIEREDGLDRKAGPPMVDWSIAVSIGSMLAGEGPTVTRTEADDVVAELRADAERSTGLVHEFTGLSAPRGTAPVLVVDRPGWVQANADGFKIATAPMMRKVLEEREPGRIAQAVGSKVTGVEVGGLLGFLAGKVLGQFDPFYEPSGRLLLVAPNIVATERKLGVDPSDFRLWVCLHEMTHQLQFTAVPWLRSHLELQIGQFVAVTDLSPDVLRERLQDVLRGVLDAARGGEGDSEGLMALVSDPAQREVLDRITAVMSLVEGHAEFVMDNVGPEVVPSVRVLRQRFAQRRKGRGPFDRVVRRLLGLEQKMKQYAEGHAFVNGVVDRVGMDGFNRVWSSPETLPRIEELTDPAAWVVRVHGRPAITA